MKYFLFQTFAILLLITQLLGCNFGLDPAINHVGNELLGQTCQLYVDSQGVPHIRPDPKFSHSNLVGLACLGFVHGRSRSYEMDYLRRTALGTQAEKVGHVEAVRLDFLFRLLNFKERAARLFETLDQPTQAALWAYSAGVNQGFRHAFAENKPYQFKKLGYQPDLWSPTDSLLVLYLQSFHQTSKSFEKQLEERQREETHGPKARGLFLGTGLPWDTFVMKDGEFPLDKKATKTQSPKSIARTSEYSKSIAPALIQALRQMESLGLDAGEGVGSNNWVLGKSRSKSGVPILANDPHLKLTRPSFWYWVHLGGGSLEPIGATLPGIPSFLSATTEKVAWGLTNSYLPAARVALVSESELKEATSFRPVVWVKWGPFRLPIFWKTFRRTPSGLPILPIEAPEGKAFVLNWTGFQISPASISALFNLSSAQNAEEADRILRQVDIPSWNFVFADTSGNIGYRAVGRILRMKVTGPFSVPEQSLKEVEEAEEFSSPLTPDEMPHLMNPARFFVATANNRQWSPQGPFEIGNAHTTSFRAFRIEELIKERTQHDLSSTQKIQCDTQAVDARFISPKLLALLRKSMQFSVIPKSVIRTLSEWNFETPLDCEACPIFRRWVQRIYDEQDLDAPALYRTLVALEASRKGLPQSLVDPLIGALKDLNITENSALPKWKDLHRTSFHPISGGSRFEAKGSLPTPGDDNSVNVGSMTWENGKFDHHTGASQRMVVEMTSPPKVYAMLAGEQEDLENPEFGKKGNRFQAWSKCELEPRQYPIQWESLQKDSVLIHLLE